MKRRRYLIYIVSAAAAVLLFLLVRSCASRNEAAWQDKYALRDVGALRATPATENVLTPRPPLPEGEGEQRSVVIASEAKRVIASEAKRVIASEAKQSSPQASGEAGAHGVRPHSPAPAVIPTKPASEASGRVEESAPTTQSDEPVQRGNAPVLTPRPPLPEGEGEQRPAVIASEAKHVIASEAKQSGSEAAPSTIDGIPAAGAVASAIPPSFGGGRGEVAFYATLGVAQLLSDVPAGSMQPGGISPGVGADFTYFFAPHWGVGAGVEAAFFNVRLFNAHIGVEQPGDKETAHLHKRTQRLSATYLRLPLWLRFRTPMQRHWLYVALGGSFDLPLAGRLRTETEWRTGSAAAQTEVTTETPAFGFSAGLLAETGLRWTLGKHWGLYTGLYAGYGLSDCSPSSEGWGEVNLLSAGAKVKIVIF